MTRLNRCPWLGRHRQLLGIVGVDSLEAISHNLGSRKIDKRSHRMYAVSYWGFCETVVPHHPRILCFAPQVLGYEVLL